MGNLAIELNSWGKVEMIPASVRHGQQQAALAEAFRQQLPDGVTITECPVLTDIGIRVGLGDVHATTPWNIAVAVGSGDLRRGDLAARAQEAWLAYEDGRMRFFDRGGERPSSAFPISVSLPDLTKGYP